MTALHPRHKHLFSTPVRLRARRSLLSCLRSSLLSNHRLKHPTSSTTLTHHYYHEVHRRDPCPLRHVRQRLRRAVRRR